MTSLLRNSTLRDALLGRGGDRRYYTSNWTKHTPPPLDYEEWLKQYSNWHRKSISSFATTQTNTTVPAHPRTHYIERGSRGLLRAPLTVLATAAACAFGWYMSQHPKHFALSVTLELGHPSTPPDSNSEEQQDNDAADA
eukprot:TRINITY_DN93687_c0_g1_i1.p1 TRINITY_DN93687_c0_g1~~TRINITY_DN93687_c0_g1_i1.p1  ORF type:complete len:139 (-),score=6.12 TRINITY_DN93687_c0_g1_i1:431-847(-)